MLAGIRHTAVLVLGCVLVTLALAACGDTPEPTPDIEATVQSRLNEERATEATVEARAQTMAKAMVEATAQAAPTAMPLPPTPTPTQTPMPLATKSPRAKSSFVIAVENHPHMFHSNDFVTRLTAHYLNPILVSQVVTTLNGVEGMVHPSVATVGQRSIDATLSRVRMTTNRVYLADHSNINIVFSGR